MKPKLLLLFRHQSQSGKILVLNLGEGNLIFCCTGQTDPNNTDFTHK